MVYGNSSTTLDTPGLSTLAGVLSTFGGTTESKLSEEAEEFEQLIDQREEVCHMRDETYSYCENLM